MSNTAAAATDSYSEEIFLEVPTASLLHRAQAISDVFVRLPSDRMVKIAHKGEQIDVDRINRLGAKDVQHLYVLKSDFSEVVTELVRGASAHSQKKIPADAKLSHFFVVAESVYTELLRLPLNDDSFARTIQITSEISTHMQQKPDFAKCLKTIVGLGDEFSRHSLGTVVIANMMMIPLNWTSKVLVDPVTMGAFFHDIGMKDIPAEIRNKERIDMTKEEAQTWESHVGIGVQLLNSLNFISPEVLRIVQEHHEVPNGTGFPSRMRGERMFPMAKLVSFANVLAHDILDADAKGFSIENLTKKIDFIYGVMYGQEMSRAALKIFRKTD